jgi:hypothetical protein
LIAAFFVQLSLWLPRKVHCCTYFSISVPWMLRPTFSWNDNSFFTEDHSN